MENLSCVFSLAAVVVLLPLTRLLPAQPNNPTKISTTPCQSSGFVNRIWMRINSFAQDLSIKINEKSMSWLGRNSLMKWRWTELSWVELSWVGWPMWDQWSGECDYQKEFGNERNERKLSECPVRMSGRSTRLGSAQLGQSGKLQILSSSIHPSILLLFYH